MDNQSGKESCPPYSPHEFSGVRSLFSSPSSQQERWADIGLHSAEYEDILIMEEDRQSAVYDIGDVDQA